MVILKYRPKGKGPPPCPDNLNLGFTDDGVHKYVWGQNLFGRASADPNLLPRLVPGVFEGRLVGKNILPEVGMSVVHCLNASFGIGKITQILDVPNDSLQLAAGGACRVLWEAGEKDKYKAGRREGYATGSKGMHTLAAVMDVKPPGGHSRPVSVAPTPPVGPSGRGTKKDPRLSGYIHIVTLYIYFPPSVHI
mmetsp:Transcript_40874/g.109379  ORF Transcript_40874/g.109379 Transcript_40874/m.109379 type:complete len:193 (-) Transcript_40874:193-771(-)